MFQPAQDFYDIVSLAKAFNLSEESIRELADSGELPSRKVKGEYIFSALALHEWLGISQSQIHRDEPSPEFKTRITQQIERYGTLLERLAKQ